MTGFAIVAIIAAVVVFAAIAGKHAGRRHVRGDGGGGDAPIYTGSCDSGGDCGGDGGGGD